MIWTAEMEQALVAMTQQPENLSYTTIAEVMSKRFDMVISKNAMIGKARRLGIPQRNGKPHKPERKPERKIKLKLVKVDAPIAPKIRKHKKGVTLQQLEHGECHWPLADVHDHPPYVFCARPTIGGTSWCREHAERAYSTPRMRWE